MRPAPTAFYVVWSPTGTTPPRVRHKTEAEAEGAAEAMARQHAGSEFFVLKATRRAVKTDVVVDVLDSADDDYPF